METMDPILSTDSTQASRPRESITSIRQLIRSSRPHSSQSTPSTTISNLEPIDEAGLASRRGFMRELYKSMALNTTIDRTESGTIMPPSQAPA
ncbi:MAG: hypothetical protein F7C08_03105 [Desulfurococcales archaeon]|nr:hypothetical protein [Desulfurococcales archaeon]